MALYYNIITKEISEIPIDIINAWVESNNPKRDIFLLVPEKPPYDPATQKNPIFVDGEWILINKTEEEIAADKRKVWSSSAKYLLEFTFEEITQISLSQDPTIAALRLLLASWAGEIWSDDPRIMNGLNILESLNIITSERKLQILTKQ